MSKKFPKRFYKEVGVAVVEGGFIVTLDGRTLKTPGKKTLLCPTNSTAALVAAEWDAVKDEINPSDMPITRMMNVTVERTPVMREALVAEARRYAGTDLLCYRADNSRVLAEQQEAAWGPWLSWAAEQGIALRITAGLIAVDQDAAALDAVAARAAAMDDLSLTLYVHLTAVFGSAILALAVIDGALDAGEAFDLSRLDARFQAQMWGEDEQAADIAAATRKETITLAQLRG